VSSGSKTHSELFLDISALLTGFDRVQLLGTGMADEYLRTLEDELSGEALDELLSSYERLTSAGEREGAVASEILGDPKWGPVARNVILMWYCGTWNALPQEWRKAYGSSPDDTDRVVSAEAYVAGLQWVAAGAHPMGAKQQGFGAWALPPEGAPR
jgi:hypothetical protein